MPMATLCAILTDPGIKPKPPVRLTTELTVSSNNVLFF